MDPTVSTLERTLDPIDPIAEAGPRIIEPLLAPTYQNRLRVIGRHLDLNGYRSIHLLEVEGGVLVRAYQPDQRVTELLEFPEGAFRQMTIDAIAARGTGDHVHAKPPLFPTGYEDALRAIGYQLDRRVAKMISLVEGSGLILVSGLGYQSSSQTSGFAPFDRILRPEEMSVMLDEAFRRRGAVAATPH